MHINIHDQEVLDGKVSYVAYISCTIIQLTCNRILLILSSMQIYMLDDGASVTQLCVGALLSGTYSSLVHLLDDCHCSGQ